MTPAMPTHAMLLAAGRGERMRPLTLHTPKPLLPVCGRPMIDHILDRLAAAGVGTAVVNLHHLGQQLRDHLTGRRAPEIVFSDESDALLDTGGGVAKALPLLGDEPFFVINGDVVWLDGVRPALRRMAASWDDSRMDALLLLHPTATAFGYDGPGDFAMSPLGDLRRRREREFSPFVNAGLQIVHPRLLAKAPDGPFSFNLLWDRAIEAGRLHGLRHDGGWYHVGTPQALEEVEKVLAYELGTLQLTADATV